MGDRVLRRIAERRHAPLAPPGSIGLLAIMKNETAVLREWIEHYRWQGVDKIFLIDNGSTDNPEVLLEGDLASGFVELHSRPAPHRQAQHYREVFRSARIRRKVEWLVMADLDEFWFSPLGDLKQGIESLTGSVDLIYANWVMFGSSGLVEQPDSIREGFVHRWAKLGGHRSTKWICRTRPMRILRFTTHHKVWGIDSRRVVTDNLTFRLHHYPIMSREYFHKVKMTRGDVSSAGADGLRTWDYFDQYDGPATELDRSLADLVRRRREHPTELETVADEALPYG